MRMADFHQDAINPQLAEILNKPELGHARERSKQLPREGLREVDLIFASVYRRIGAELKSGVLQGDPSAIGEIRGDIDKLMEYYRTTEQFRVLERPEDLQLQDTYDANNVVLHMEGADIVTDPDVLNELYERGLRSLGPVYSHDNLLGGGADGKKERGLTSLGKRVVDRAVELGMVVDISHANRRTAHDILERVQQYEKSVATHTGFGPNQRMITPELIRKIAKRGGVVGLTPAIAFFPTFEKYIDAYDQLAQLTGSSEHSAIGTDFGGLPPEMVYEDFDDIGKLARVGEELSNRGFGDDDIAKIMYGNIERVVKKL